MRIIIDLIVTFGGLFISAGVFLQFGISWALITSGALLIGLGLKSAKIYELNNVPDSE